MNCSTRNYICTAAGFGWLLSEYIGTQQAYTHTHSQLLHSKHTALSCFCHSLISFIVTTRPSLTLLGVLLQRCRGFSKTIKPRHRCRRTPLSAQSIKQPQLAITAQHGCHQPTQQGQIMKDISRFNHGIWTEPSLATSTPCQPTQRLKRGDDND